MAEPRLVLASTSPYRRELLARLRVPFDCVPPGVDESVLPGEGGEVLARRLARQKAEAVARRHPDRTVIGSDQVALLDGIQLGKPGTRDRAVSQLKQASGRTVAFHTAVCLVTRERALVTEGMDTTRVTFRVLSPALIESYVDLEQPFDCAGSAKAEGLGIALIERIESDDPTGLIGLPLILVTAMLPTHGITVLPRDA